MRAARSVRQAGLPPMSPRVTTPFVLSVGTRSGTPMTMDACATPMKGFSRPALGENSTQQVPRWRQAIARQATRHSRPRESATFTKPRSFWHASPGAAPKRLPRLPRGATAFLFAGARRLRDLMWPFAAPTPPRQPPARRASGTTDELATPFPSRAPATGAWPAVTVVFAFAPHLPRLVAPDPSASIVLALDLVSPARLANSARLTSLGSGGPPGAKPMPPRASSMIPCRPLRSLRLTSVVPLTPACRQKPVQVAQRRSGRLRLLWVATLFRLYVAIIARLQQLDVVHE